MKGVRFLEVGDMVLLGGAVALGAHLHLYHPEMPIETPGQPLSLGNLGAMTATGSTTSSLSISSLSSATVPAYPAFQLAKP